jgi:hypothetical protein
MIQGSVKAGWLGQNAHCPSTGAHIPPDLRRNIAFNDRPQAGACLFELGDDIEPVLASQSIIETQSRTLADWLLRGQAFDPLARRGNQILYNAQ